mmetsp:Transcript_20348/g.49157  ORF Transcript_20348/g.49157 Transcript_20348/m.49157 type:complete len:528 (+) Transcript_20348:885-2468(+)
MLDDGVGVGALREDLEEYAVGAEVEPRETVALRLQVPREGLLAELELLREVGEERLHHLVPAAALHAVRHLERLLGDFHKVLVDALEALGLLRQLLRNVARREDRLHVDPEVLHPDPLLYHVGDCREIRDPLLHLVAERRGVAVASHAPQSHLRLLKSLHDFRELLCRKDHRAAVLEVGEGKRHVVPDGDDLRELRLDLQLFVRPARDVLNVLNEVDHPKRQNVRKLARLGRRAVLVHREAVPTHPLDAFPVSHAHRLVRALLEHRQHLEEIVNGALELRVCVPVTQLLGHPLAQRLEARSRLSHRVDLRHDVYPHQLSIPLDCDDDRDVQPVELVEQLQLRLAEREFRVLSNRQPKEPLPLAVRVPLALALLEETLVLGQALGRLHRRHSLDHRAVQREVGAEFLGISHELLYVLCQRLLEPGLEPRELVRGDHRLRLDLAPRLAERVEVVKLLLVDVHLVLGEEVVLLLDRHNLVVDLALLLPDELEHSHDVAHVVEVVQRPVQLLERLLHHVLQLQHLLPRLGV